MFTKYVCMISLFTNNAYAYNCWHMTTNVSPFNEQILNIFVNHFWLAFLYPCHDCKHCCKHGISMMWSLQFILRMLLLVDFDKKKHRRNSWFVYIIVYTIVLTFAYKLFSVKHWEQMRQKNFFEYEKKLQLIRILADMSVLLSGKMLSIPHPFVWSDFYTKAII